MAHFVDPTRKVCQESEGNNIQPLRLSGIARDIIVWPWNVLTRVWDE